MTSHPCRIRTNVLVAPTREQSHPPNVNDRAWRIEDSVERSRCAVFPILHPLSSTRFIPERRLPLPPLDPRTDAELVDALNDGDTSAFDALYYRYRDWVVRLAVRF